MSITVDDDRHPGSQAQARCNIHETATQPATREPFAMPYRYGRCA